MLMTLVMSLITILYTSLILTLVLLFSVVSSELVLLSKLTSVLENPSKLQQEVHKLTTARITAAASDKEAV